MNNIINCGAPLFGESENPLEESPFRALGNEWRGFRAFAVFVCCWLLFWYAVAVIVT